MESLRKTVVIMCVWVSLQHLMHAKAWLSLCYNVLYFTQAEVTRSPIKSHRKTTSHTVIRAPLCINSAVLPLQPLDNQSVCWKWTATPPFFFFSSFFFFFNHGWHIAHNGYCLGEKKTTVSTVELVLGHETYHSWGEAHHLHPLCCMQFVHVLCFTVQSFREEKENPDHDLNYQTDR